MEDPKKSNKNTSSSNKGRERDLEKDNKKSEDFYVRY